MTAKTAMVSSKKTGKTTYDEAHPELRKQVQTPTVASLSDTLEEEEIGRHSLG